MVAVAGLCGLSYEQPAYEYLNNITPNVGSIVKTKDGNGMVTEVNLLRGLLKVSLDKNEGTPKEYNVRDITLIKKGTRRRSNDGMSTKNLGTLTKVLKCKNEYVRHC